MELDDINPTSWAALEGAAEDYITAHDAEFDAAARALCHNAGAGTIFDPALERLGMVTPAPTPPPPSHSVDKLFSAPVTHPLTSSCCSVFPRLGFYRGRLSGAGPG